MAHPVYRSVGYWCLTVAKTALKDTSRPQCAWRHPRISPNCRLFASEEGAFARNCWFRTVLSRYVQRSGFERTTRTADVKLVTDGR